MSLFAKCLTVFVILAVAITTLFEVVLYPDMPLSSNILFGPFAAIMLTIFYGWIDEMFISKHQPGVEE
jgi:hypothetical protein